MADIGIRLQVDDSDYKTSLDKALENLKAIEEQEISLSKVKPFNGLNDSLKELSPELIKAADETEKVVNRTEEAKNSAKNAAKEYKLFGVSINDVTGKLAKWKTGLIAAKGALTSTSGALKVFKVALLSTGIGALIVGLGSLVAFFTRTQEGLDRISQAFAFLGGAIEPVIDVFEELGGTIVDALLSPVDTIKSTWSGLLTFIKNPIDGIKSAVSGLKDGIVDLTNEIARESVEALNLEKAKQKLRDAEIALQPEIARTRNEIAKSRAIAKDETKSLQERQQALISAARLEDGLLLKRIALAEENVRIIQKQNSLSNNLTADNKALADAEVALANVQRESTNLQIRLQTELNTILNKQRAEMAALQKEFQSLNADLIQQVTDIELERLDPIQRLERQRELTITAMNDQRDRLIKIAQDLGVPLDEINKRFEIVLGDINNKFGRQIEVLKNQFEGLEGLEIDPLVLNDNAIPITLEIDTNDRTKQTLRESLNEIGGLIDDIVGSPEFTAFQSAFTSITDGITAGIDRQIDAIERQKDANAERIDELEAQIDREEALAKKGFANNVEILKDELEARKEQEEGYNEEINELREKQIKAQLAQDLVQQASSFGVAIAEIFKAHAGIPFVGVALAAGAIATMFTTVANAKAQINALQDTQLYTGTDGSQISDFVGQSVPMGSSDLNGGGYRLHDKKSGKPTNVIISGRESLVPEQASTVLDELIRDVTNNPEYYEGRNLLAELNMPDIAGEAKALNAIRIENKKSDGISREDLEAAMNKAFAKHQMYLDGSETINYLNGEPTHKVIISKGKEVRVRLR